MDDDRPGTGAALVARGEFFSVIAGLAVTAGAVDACLMPGPDSLVQITTSDLDAARAHP